MTWKNNSPWTAAMIWTRTETAWEKKIPHGSRENLCSDTPIPFRRYSFSRKGFSYQKPLNSTFFSEP